MKRKRPKSPGALYERSLNVHLGERGWEDLLRCQQVLAQNAAGKAAPALGKIVKIALHALRLKVLNELGLDKKRTEELWQEYLEMMESSSSEATDRKGKR